MDLVFDALAHPTRRRILEMLKGGGMTAGTIADAFAVSKPTISGHFAKLKAAGLIQGESRGTATVYTLNLSVLDEVILSFMNRVRSGKGEEPCPSAA